MTVLDLAVGAPTCPSCRTTLAGREAPFGARFGGSRHTSFEWYCPDPTCDFDEVRTA